MRDIIDLSDKVTFAGRGTGFKKVHITIPTELFDAFTKRYPYGCRSRIISVALADKLKKDEEKELNYMQQQFRRQLLINTDWEDVTDIE